LCGHTGGESIGSGQEVSTKLEAVVVASWTAGKKRRRNTMGFQETKGVAHTTYEIIDSA
jgi:hypothetical protein